MTPLMYGLMTRGAVPMTKAAKFFKGYSYFSAALTLIDSGRTMEDESKACMER